MPPSNNGFEFGNVLFLAVHITRSYGLIVSTLIAALAPLELLTNLRAQRKDRHNAVLPD